MAKFGFDSEGVEERKGYEPLPAGKYTMVATESEIKPTKSNDGERLIFKFQVVGGEYDGRTLLRAFNIKNPSQEAEKISREELAEFSRAVGKPRWSDSEELHNLRFIADLTVNKGKPYMKDGVEVEGQMRNEVRKYLPADQSAATAADPVASSSGKKPWVR